MEPQHWIHRLGSAHGPAAGRLLRFAQPAHDPAAGLWPGRAAAYAEGARPGSISAWLLHDFHALDRADGILARLSGKMSKFGHYFDLVSDSVCNARSSSIGLRRRAALLRAGWLDHSPGRHGGPSVMFVLSCVMWAEGQRACARRAAASVPDSMQRIHDPHSDHRLARWEPAASLCLGDGGRPSSRSISPGCIDVCCGPARERAALHRAECSSPFCPFPRGGLRPRLLRSLPAKPGREGEG